jgi:hypothetical protein
VLLLDTNDQVVLVLQMMLLLLVVDHQVLLHLNILIVLNFTMEVLGQAVLTCLLEEK